ncbi:MoxR-like ATPase [Microbacterium sp. AG790]|uniref:AAA family ATPase n=1 Tax=Microbacterium sp. AG790 TaxID=2183995 RepID=UPI000EB2AE2B|nr:AAA family ATPase [Microbacterium sp. AG790]RKS93076.1 MoxR-like ATPase [Microbacterium sp. AG790]
MTAAGAGREGAASGFWRTSADELAARFPGRREQIRALQLAVLAREHVFLLGPPGTGKTALVRAFTAGLEGRLFEQTLSRTRPDAAVLGPLDIPALRDEGRYRRAIEGYLLDCEWAFLDEIGHISPDLGHDLLAALGDRVRHDVDGGRSTHGIPLHTAFTAGNAIPAGDGTDDARALWDRLLVRVPVDYLSRTDAHALLTADPMRTADAATRPRVRSRAELAEDVAAVGRVRIAPDVVDAVLTLRERLTGAGDVFSDRRWRAGLGLLRASAWLDGRDDARPSDLLALRFALWDTPDQRPAVLAELARVADPALADALALVERARLLADVCRGRAGEDAATRRAWAREAQRKQRVLVEAARRLAPRAEASDVEGPDVDAALAEAARAVAALAADPDDAGRAGGPVPIARARIAG